MQANAGQCKRSEGAKVPTITRWTGHNLCALQDALGLTNERFAERIKVAVRTVANWRTRGHEVLPDLAQRVLPTTLAEAPPAVRERFEALLVRSVVRHADAIDDTIGSAADEVDADKLILASDFDAAAVAELWEDARSVAHANNRSALEIFTAAQRIRWHAHELAERTRRPGTLSDLYVIIGQSTALMASTAFDLNRWGAAEALAKSAGSYAGMAGNAALQAWVLGLRATLANWRDEPDAAIGLFRRGLELAPPGTPRLRLRYIASRSYALLGDVESVRDVLTAADQDWDDAAGRHDALSEETGGEFAFGAARAAACAAASWLDVSQGDEAEEQAQRALRDLNSLPRGRRPFSQVAGAQIDMASARLLGGKLDGAAEALTDVLALPDHMRNVSLAGRMARVRDSLADGAWTGDPEAVSFRESIDTWLQEADAIRLRQVNGLPR